MCMLRLSHLLAIVPIALLLTLSFFVLLAIRKAEEKTLKAFGYVVVSFIWLAMLVIFSSAVYNMARSSILMERICQRNMRMERMGQMMQKDSMPKMNMPGMAISKKKMSKCGGNKGFLFKAQ